MTGKPQVVGELQRGFFVFDRAVGARQQRQAGLLHRAARARLVAHQADHLRIGADEPDVAGLADFGEVRRFRQEAVPGMDGVGAGDLRGADDRRHVQIALGAARGADAHVLVGKPHVQRVLVGLRIHRHGLDAQLAARDDDAHRDLAAVRDQNFLKHWALWRTAARRTARAGRSRRRPSRLSPSYSESISFISFIASMMQSTCPFLTVVPTSTNGGGARLGRAEERADDRRFHDREIDFVGWRRRGARHRFERRRRRRRGRLRRRRRRRAEPSAPRTVPDAFTSVPFLIRILKPSRSSSNSLSSCSRTMSRMRLISSNSMRLCEARWDVCEHFDPV